jgi:hypothetical protein
MDRNMYYVGSSIFIGFRPKMDLTALTVTIQNIL